jgi:hypothetical protein
VALKYFRLRGRDAALLGRAPDIDEPISSEIFSVERLEQYAAILAKTQEVARTNLASISLHARLRDNSAVLSSVYQTLLRRMRRAKAVTRLTHNSGLYSAPRVISVLTKRLAALHAHSLRRVCLYQIRRAIPSVRYPT